MSSDTEVDDLVLEHLRGIRGDIAKLGLKIDLLEGRLAGVEARMSGIEARMTALEERMATVEARLGKIEFVLVDKGPDLSD